MPDDNDSKWHLDKKVPLALIFTIGAQTVVAAWGASNLWARVGELEKQQVAAQPRLESVIKLETKMDMIQAGLTEIKSALTALAATKEPPSRR